MLIKVKYSEVLFGDYIINPYKPWDLRESLLKIKKIVYYPPDTVGLFWTCGQILRNQDDYIAVDRTSDQKNLHKE